MGECIEISIEEIAAKLNVSLARMGECIEIFILSLTSLYFRLARMGECIEIA